MKLIPFFPAFASFGPLLIAISCAADGWPTLAAILGALMTSGALMTLFGLSHDHHKKLTALEVAAQDSTRA